MNKDSKILIVGCDDIIERSLNAYFDKEGYGSVWSSTRIGLNCSIQPAVYDFFQKNRPEYVFLGSTRSGGIQANMDYPADFIYHNMASQTNVLYSAWKFSAKKVLFYASSCVYPKNAPQPINENTLMQGAVEETSVAYAIAKIAGVKLCQAFREQYRFNAIVAVPATVYGPQDKEDLAKAHVIGALITKFADAILKGENKVSVWGSGNPKREFLYSDDFVDASLFLMSRYDEGMAVNIGSGQEISIKDLAGLIAEEIGFKGMIDFDVSKPDGVERKFLDSSRLTAAGWKARTILRDGIRKTLEQKNNKALA